MNSVVPNEVLQREIAFHDAWAGGVDAGDVKVLATFEACTCPENRWLLSQCGDVRGLRVLDLGSGQGEASVFFALRGADVTATDISPEMLKLVGRVAKLHGVRVRQELGTAEDLSRFPDASFDVVYAANILHHVDIRRTLDEIHRVLSAGGRALLWDPLAYNPIINVYRRMATKNRSDDEHPLRRRDVEYVMKRFTTVKVRFFWLATLAIFGKFFFIDRLHPNAARYWKLIIDEAERLAPLYRRLEALDKILCRIPLLRWAAWNIAVIGRKGD